MPQEVARAPATEFEPPFASASDLLRAILARRLSSSEVVQAHLEQIRRRNPEVNAIVTLDEEGARKRAREADDALRRGRVWGALHGVPITVKDCLAVRGMRTTLGSPALPCSVPTRDGAAVGRLRRAGAIVLGKTNVSEGLRDWQTDNTLFGRTRNPWDPGRTAGGSSGGSAAAVAAGFAALDVGSDLGGSIRVPAHFCGVYGFKPTQGRVPEAGHLWPPAHSRRTRLLNSIGPLARSAEDLLRAFRVLAGARGAARRVPKVLRVAWMPPRTGLPVAADIERAIQKCVSALERSGARVRACLPRVDLEEQWTLRERLRDVVTGAAPSSRAEFRAALSRRDLFIARWEEFFRAWDVFLCPAAATTAFLPCKAGTPQNVDGRPVEYRRLFFFSTLFNCTGHPAVVIPVSWDRQGLPVGVQIVGPRQEDERLLAVAASLSQLVGPFDRPPGF